MLKDYTQSPCFYFHKIPIPMQHVTETIFIEKHSFLIDDLPGQKSFPELFEFLFSNKSFSLVSAIDLWYWMIMRLPKRFRPQVLKFSANNFVKNLIIGFILQQAAFNHYIKYNKRKNEIDLSVIFFRKTSRWPVQFFLLKYIYSFPKNGLLNVLATSKEAGTTLFLRLCNLQIL